MTDPTPDLTLESVRAQYPGVQTGPDSDRSADAVLAGVDGIEDVDAETLAVMHESLSLWFARSFDEAGDHATEDGA